MKNWFYEVLMVMMLSKRVYWSLMLGMVGFIGISIWGQHQASGFELTGHMAPLGDAMRAFILKHYDKAAFGCLATFWIQAFRFYQKDRKRLYNSF